MAPSPRFAASDVSSEERGRTSENRNFIQNRETEGRPYASCLRRIHSTSVDLEERGTDLGISGESVH